MKRNLEQFSTECRTILARDLGVEGRKKVCALVRTYSRTTNLLIPISPMTCPSAKCCTKIPNSDFASSVTFTTVPRTVIHTITALLGQSTVRRRARLS